MTPNPTAGRTAIVFSLAVGGPFRLDVVDVQGREAAEVLEDVEPRGRYVASWDGAGRTHFAPGAYFVKMSTAGRTATRKLVVER